MKKSAIRNIVVLAITTAVILVGVWLVQNPPGSSTAGSVSTIDSNTLPGMNPPAIGETAPNFFARSTAEVDYQLATMRGKPVWLLFVATWCATCRAEAPDVEALAQTYGDRVHILTIYAQETETGVKEYIEELGLTSPQIADSSGVITALYGVMGLPAHYFIDADGVVQKIVVGRVSQRIAKTALDAML
jgi:thiol-disulfide isomerase/thioredoxin